jgi:hypothetical protein
VETRKEIQGWKHAHMQAGAEATRKIQKARKAAADAAKAAVKGFAGGRFELSLFLALTLLL